MSSVVGGFKSSVYMLVLPLYLLEMGINIVGLGIFFSVFTTICAITGFLAGAHSDKIGRKAYLIPFAVLVSVLNPIYLVCANLPAFLFLNSLRALFGSIAGAAYNPMVIDLIKRKEYGRKLGKLHGLHFAGRALGFLLTGLIIVQIGFYLIFFLLVLAECIRVLLLWAFIPEPRTTSPSSKMKFVDLKGLPRNVIVLCLLYFVMYLVATPTDMFINQVYAFDFLGATSELIGIMLVGTCVAEAIMAPLGGRLADKFDRRKIVALGVIGEGIVVLCQPLYSRFAIFAFFLILEYLVDAANFPAQQAIEADSVRKRRRGLDLALLSLSCQFGGILGASTLSVIIFSMGYLYVFFIKACLYWLVAPIFLFALISNKKM